jgi:hypothetical protein
VVFLTAAVVVLAAMTLFNLLLSLGLVRRIRQYGDLLAERQSPATAAPQLMHAVGSQISPFESATVDGDPVVLAGRTIVAFFSPTCGGCEKAIGDFVPYAAEVSGGASQVLAVVAGRGGETADRFVSMLSSVARVVREPENGPASRAFGVSAVPVFGVLNDANTLEITGFRVDQLPEPATV